MDGTSKTMIIVGLILRLRHSQFISQKSTTQTELFKARYNLKQNLKSLLSNLIKFTNQKEM